MTGTQPCPVAEMARVLGRKWVLQIIHHLREPRGFRELQQRLGNINPTLLSQRLKFLEEEGIVERVVHPQRPPRSVYCLTAKGRELLPLLDALADWARRWQASSLSEEVPHARGQNPRCADHRHPQTR